MTESGDEIPARFTILAAGTASDSLIATLSHSPSRLMAQGKLSVIKSHLIAVRPRIGSAPFCIADRNGFNHLPHGRASVVNSNRWIAAKSLSDREVVSVEVKRVQRFLQALFPEAPQSGRNVLDWAGTTVQMLVASARQVFTSPPLGWTDGQPHQRRGAPRPRH